MNSCARLCLQPLQCQHSNLGPERWEKEAKAPVSHGEPSLGRQIMGDFVGTPPASSTGHLQTPARYQRRLPVPWEVWAACQAWDAGFGPSHCFDWGCCLDSGSLSLLSSDSFLMMSNHRSDVTSLCLKLSDIRCGGKQGPLLLRGKQRKELTLQSGHIR